MKAVVWHGVGDIRLEDVPEPKIQSPMDAIVRVTTSAICGTDLHLVRGTVTGMREGTVVGHEAVGVVVDVGSGVRNFAPGDRVIVPSTIACGYCSYCRSGYQSQCDNANPGGSRAGTAYYGGPEASGSFDGLQAEYARIPFANANMVGIPAEVTDEQAIMLSDIFPTAWFGARLAEVDTGDTVAIFGCGPVGQLAIVAAQQHGAGRVIAVDRYPDRLGLARAQHAEVINFEDDDPVTAIAELTGGIGVDRVIDAVGVDAVRPSRGPAAEAASQQQEEFDWELRHVAPVTNPDGDSWLPGDAPGQVSQWAVEAVAKAGTVGIIGVYPDSMTSFPFGAAMNKNLTLKGGNCHHRHYLPELLELVIDGAIDPATVLTTQEPMTDVLSAYREFDRREPGWIKVALTTAA